jgi:hypothetical protein
MQAEPIIPQTKPDNLGHNIEHHIPLPVFIHKFFYAEKCKDVKYMFLQYFRASGP